MKRIALGLSMYSAIALIGIAVVYIQIRIIHDCGLLSLVFGAAEWRWFLGYCS